jgi:hypothetical protein
MLVGVLRICFDSEGCWIRDLFLFGFALFCFAQINSTKFNWSKEFSFYSVYKLCDLEQVT